MISLVLLLSSLVLAKGHVFGFSSSSPYEYVILRRDSLHDLKSLRSGRIHHPHAEIMYEVEMTFDSNSKRLTQPIYDEKKKKFDGRSVIAWIEAAMKNMLIDSNVVLDDEWHTAEHTISFKLYAEYFGLERMGERFRIPFLDPHFGQYHFEKFSNHIFINDDLKLTVKSMYSFNYGRKLVIGLHGKPVWFDWEFPMGIRGHRDQFRAFKSIEEKYLNCIPKKMGAEFNLRNVIPIKLDYTYADWDKEVVLDALFVFDDSPGRSTYRSYNTKALQTLKKAVDGGECSLSNVEAYTIDLHPYWKPIKLRFVGDLYIHAKLIEKPDDYPFKKLTVYEYMRIAFEDGLIKLGVMHALLKPPLTSFNEHDGRITAEVTIEFDFYKLKMTRSEFLLPKCGFFMEELLNRIFQRNFAYGFRTVKLVAHQ